jgi:adenine-specific DNA-methyltransferase
MVPKDFIEDIQNNLATREVRDLGLDYDFPKPVKLLHYLMGLQPPAPDDIIVDFFAGSGTTGHAVMQANAADGEHRRFILVQLPEPIEGDFPTIAAITRERVRRAGRAIAAEREGKCHLDEHGTPDLGFRAYALTASNFKPWAGDADGMESAALQIAFFTDNLLPDRTPEDILTEVLLRAGYELTAPVETWKLAGKEVFSVAAGALLVCLERPLTIEVIEAMAARDPAQIVCLESGFGGDDALKVNAVQTVKALPNTILKVI